MKKKHGVSVKIGPMGTIEPSFIRTPNQDNQQAISIPIETNNIRPTTIETREFMNEQKNIRVKEEIEKIEQHKKLGDEDIKVEDIDDNMENSEQTEIDEEYLQKCIEEIIKSDDDIEEIFTKEEVRERLEKELENGRSIVEAKEIAQKELAEDAGHFKGRGL